MKKLNTLAKAVVPMFVILLLLAFAVVDKAGASADGLGSQNDPLSTKSYVDSRIDEVIRLIGSSEDSPLSSEFIASQVQELISEAVGSKGLSFVPVKVQMGQSIICGEGTELIMRSGDGYAIALVDKIVNATSGTDIANNAKIPKNNLMIFPRDDGRGIKVVNDAWFMVKGSYKVQ